MTKNKHKKESSAVLRIEDLHASVEGKEILNGVAFEVKPGETHVVMGPNGSGKSTLANVLMGHPFYELTGATDKTMLLGGVSMSDMSPQERAKNGLFLAFQSPISIPGVSVSNLLRASYQALHGEQISDQPEKPQTGLKSRWNVTDITLGDFLKTMKEAAKTLHIPESFLSRGIHEGFSGGEKKKIEMLQALVLRPKIAIFDEIDTGLDVDALKVVARGIGALTEKNVGVIVITHYQRILHHLTPDVVHVLVSGKIVDTGDADLAQKIETDGYKKYTGNTRILAK